MLNALAIIQFLKITANTERVKLPL